MATYYKKSVNANLSLNTAWSATGSGGADNAGPPTNADTAIWQSGSLGTGLSGAVSIGTVSILDAANDIAYGTNTLTVGKPGDATSGFAFATTNTKRFAINGAVAVGANNQTWTLYNGGTGGTNPSHSLLISGAMTGSADISVANASPSATFGYAYIVVSSTTSTYSGTLTFGDRTALYLNAAGQNLGANAKFTFSGANTFLSGATDGVTHTLAGSLLTIDNDVTWGSSTFATRALSIATTTVALGASTRTLTVNATSTITGAITGTAGFTKAGAGTLDLTANSPLFSGNVAVTAGVLRVSGGNYLPALSGLSISSGATAYWRSLAANFAFPCDISGAGAFHLNGNLSTTGVTFAAGRLTNLTGAGSEFRLPSASATGLSNTVATINETSWSVAKVTFSVVASATTATATSRFLYAGSGLDTTASIIVDSSDNTQAAYITNSVNEVYANGTGALKFTGTVQRTNSIGTPTAGMTLTLRGTSAAGINNELSNVISDLGSPGTLAIAKADTNRWILSGANTYTGATSIAAGTLVAASTSAFGSSTSGVVIQTGGTIELASSVNKGSLATALISNAGATALSLPTSGNSYTYTCGGVTLSSPIIVDVAASSTLTMSNSGAMTGAGFGITKNGAGEYILNNTANTFTGAVTVNAGTLSITALANTSFNSSLGTGAGTSAIALTGTLKYIGTIGTSTNRSITFTGAAPVLDASGTVDAATATYSACTQAAGARTITFTGTNAGANTFSAGLADTGGGALVSVSKQGAGKWILSGALTYTGTTTVAAGTLNLGGTNRTLTGALSISGGTLENSTNTVSANTTMTGGTITAELTGAKTLDVNSGSDATLQPTNNANTFSGNTTVAAGGVLKLITGVSPATAATGRVLGTSAVSVSGTIKTGASAPQRGQMRYGGNLTFNSGAVLNIGGA